MRNVYKVLLESLKESDHSEDLGVDGRIILKWVLRKSVFEDFHSNHLAQDGQIAVSCEQCSEPVGSITGRGMLDHLNH